MHRILEGMNRSIAINSYSFPKTQPVIGDILPTEIEVNNTHRCKVTYILDHINLISKIANERDKNAFSDLFGYFAPRIKSMMMKQGTDHQTAEELAQEAMISVWRKSYLFNPEKASPSTWIYTIARNLRIDRFRKENRPEFDPKDPALIPETPLSADIVISLKEREDIIRSKILLLPTEQKEVVHLSFVEGLTHQEISIKLNIPLGTVKSRLRLSFEKLKPMLRNVQ